MISKVKALIVKYWDILLYLVFGGLTTLVNIVTYWLCAHVLHVTTVPSTVIAWAAAVAFAFFTNRKWVFHSTVSDAEGILKEAAAFVSCRLLTGLFDVACMFVFVDFLHWNDLFVKIADNVIVVILNYIASKLFIFRKK